MRCSGPPLPHQAVERATQIGTSTTPTPEPTSGSTPRSTASPAPGSTPGPTAESEPPEWVPLHFIHVSGIVVDLAPHPFVAPHPARHAWDLLHELVRDVSAGHPVTEKAIRKYYIAICRAQGIKPFPWLSVLRHFNRLLMARLWACLQEDLHVGLRGRPPSEAAHLPNSLAHGVRTLGVRTCDASTGAGAGRRPSRLTTALLSATAPVIVAGSRAAH